MPIDNFGTTVLCYAPYTGVFGRHKQKRSEACILASRKLRERSSFLPTLAERRHSSSPCTVCTAFIKSGYIPDHTCPIELNTPN